MYRLHAALQLLALFVFPIPRYFNRTCGQIGCAAGTPTEQIAANRVFHEIVVFPRQDKVPQVYTVSDATAPSFVVQFDELALLPGDSLVVRDAAACSSLRLTANNTTQSFSRMEDAPNSAGAVMIHGASVVVEYFPSLSTLTLPVYRPERDNAVAKIRLHVRSGVAAYFRSPVSRSNSESIVGGRNEMKEAVCYKRSRPQMYAHAKAVARLTITKQSKNPITTSDLSSDRGNSALSDSKDEDDVIYCTGWLLGRGNHMMTNYHCLFSMPSVLKDVPVGRFATNHGEESDERMIAQRFQNITSTSVNFMAETQHCNDRGTTGEKLGVIEATNVTVVAANEALDYCLLRVDMAPSLVERLQRKGPVDLAKKYGYLTLRSTGARDLEEIYIPQHPNGEPKTIAACKNGRPAIVRVLSAESVDEVFASIYASEKSNPTVIYNADTKPGSSGSPVLSQDDNTVVALHHAGGTVSASIGSAMLESFNAGIRVDDIIRDLTVRGVLPPCALARDCPSKSKDPCCKTE